MNQFIITAPSYTGEVKVLYGGNNELLTIEFSFAQLTTEQVEYFKKTIPAVYFQNLFASSFSSKLTIVPGDFEVSFDMWWHKYGKKINRKRCEPLYKKYSKADQVAAFYGIDPYDKFLARHTYRPKADPEKYLKDRYWENEWK